MHVFCKGQDLVLRAEEHNDDALISALMASKACHSTQLDVVNLMVECADSSNNVHYATGVHRCPHAAQADAIFKAVWSLSMDCLCHMDCNIPEVVAHQVYCRMGTG